ncbi:metal-dependent hydrolase [Pseudonocardia sp. 73-21]|uniref:metal-dependent hydrolase n=1 Tax=Pseudonocardia sp. 73-21 TaxID=1895809 RepID=UPI00095FE965|nr:metal-dependent hydrolase [Pseudonocardia sp. 73-21]OJY39900.1 MAG: metal-dependent hydrolase [Pseudonocardia sp. 73-21]
MSGDDRIALTARAVAFDWSALPVHWIPGEPFATHLLDVLHLLLPEGERWFVRVFGAALPLVRDPALAEDVRGFIGQEAMHASSHQGVLDHFAARGVDTSPYVRQVEWMFTQALGERDLTGDAAREWLVERVALIAAIEHVTAFLGQWVLDARALDAAGTDPTMLDLLRWHGAEEVEHRAVAHDLLVHLDSRYSRRVRALIPAVPILVRLWAQGVGFLLRRDPVPTRARWRDLHRAATLGLCPAFRPTLRAMAAYLRPGYHPSHYGSTDAAVAYLATSSAARAADERAA